MHLPPYFRGPEDWLLSSRTRPTPAIALLLTCLLLWCCRALAADHPANMPTVTLTPQLERVILNSHTHHLIDESGEASLAQIQRASASRWLQNPKGTINFGQSAFPYWFRTHVTGLDQLQQTTYLRVDYAHLDELDIFLVRDGNIVEQHHTGDTTPFSSRPIPYRTYLVPLSADRGASLDIYVRIATEGPIQAPLDILTRAELDRQDKLNYLWFGAYFGIMIIMLFYNGLIFVFVRDLSYFLYLLYIGATAFLQFTLHGFSFQFLWPESTSLNNSMILVLTGLMPFTAIAFVWRFIGLTQLGTRLEKSALQLLFAGFSVVLVGAFTMHYMTVLKLAHTLSFLAVSLGFYLGLKYWIKGVKAARIFALAWFVYLVFILLYLLDIKGIIQPNVISLHALEIGSALELVLLSLAFADRLNTEKELRLQAQLKLNQDLDLLVRERTEELEQANLKLKEVSITDGLTDLYNRRHFDEVFGAEYQRAFREKQPVGILMIDMDHFKQINDTYGHPFGDLCLQRAAEVIRDAIRRPPDLAARYGGEEFVVLLPNTDTNGAACVAETIRRNLEATVVSDGNHSVHLTASVGAGAEIPPARQDLEKLLKRVDHCLYQAKHGGRNQVVAAAPNGPAALSA